jgi:hypothetical protein
VAVEREGSDFYIVFSSSTSLAERMFANSKKERERETLSQAFFERNTLLAQMAFRA